jgi:hypothetical protein
MQRSEMCCSMCVLNVGCSGQRIDARRSSTFFRRNATALCQPRPAAWVFGHLREREPQRGDPNEPC